MKNTPPHGKAGITCTFLLLVSTVIFSSTTRADSNTDEGRWQYELTPYVWATGLNGNVRVNDRPKRGLAVNQEFSDILERLDFGAMGTFEARKNRWGVLLDGIYFKVSDSHRITGPRGFVSLSATASITQELYAAGGYFRLTEGETPVDLVGGLRYNSVRWNIRTSASIPVLPGPSRNFSQRKHWVDPYVGLRVQHHLSDKWTLLGYGDVGGFGIGSDLSWQAQAGASYAFSPNMMGKIGYRHLSNDYSKEGFTYDMDSSGIYMGLGIAW